MITFTYSGELRFNPNVVRSIPGARAMRLWSFSLAARRNVRSPAIPNWSVTIPEGILDTIPVGKSVVQINLIITW